MSIIRQRSKNLIFSGLVGFIGGLILVLLVYMIGIRGNLKVIEWILNDSQLEVMTMTEPVDEPEVVMDQVIRLTRSISKDSIITEDMLEIVDLEAVNTPANYSKDLQQLIGKKALIDLEASSILTAGMIQDINVFNVSFETLEIQGVHYPDILEIGQSINMRIHYPTGQDYTVLANKNVVHIDIENKSFFLDLTEEEILGYSSAIEDANIFPGTQLYVTIEGNGNVDMSQESSAVLESYKQGLIYDIYPLNPNVLALSQVKNFDTSLLEDRVVLDESLKAFFDLNSERFSYEIELKEQKLESDQEEKSDLSSNELGLDEDQVMTLQASSSKDLDTSKQVKSTEELQAAKESNELANRLDSNSIGEEAELTSNSVEVAGPDNKEEDVMEVESKETQLDFDF